MTFPKGECNRLVGPSAACRAGPFDELRVHRELMQDRVRCEAYRAALFAAVQPGDAVLDVGAGSGIMAMFAAQAGARKVYAVERTPIATLAGELVRESGLSDRVTVIEAEMDSVELPEQVDVIVSELLGGFGVDENSFGVVLLARDRWLKPGGRLLPERVTAWMAPAWDDELANIMGVFSHSWLTYGLKLRGLLEPTANEVFYGHQHVGLDDLRAPPEAMWLTDFYTCPAGEMDSSHEASLSFAANDDGLVNALALWFTADLAAGHTLRCGPGAKSTHWGTTVCPLRRAVDVRSGAAIAVDFQCEPEEPGRSSSRWSVRIDDGPPERHDQRLAFAGQRPWR